MIESILVRRLSGITLLLAAALSALAFSSGSVRVAAAIGTGAFLGLLPIITWSWLGAAFIPNPHRAEAQQGLIGRDRNSAKADPPSPLAFGVISLAKLLLYAAALAYLIGGNRVDPLAFAGSLLAPGLLLALMVSMRRTEAAA